MQNLPPMDRSPHVEEFSRTQRLVFRSHIQLFNAYLDDYISTFTSKYPGSSVLLFDTHAEVSAILSTPAEYGFSKTGFCQAYAHRFLEPDAFDEDACKVPLSEYLYYDSYHLSWKAQALLANGVNNQLSYKAEVERHRHRRDVAKARRFGSKWSWGM